MKKQVTVEMWSFKPPQFLNKLLVLLLLSITSFQALAQSGTVTGKVLDDKGEPIIGATIEVIDAFKKNIGGTVTDMDGNYSIEVKDMNLSSLKFSFLGNKTQTVQVKGQAVIDAKLAEDSEVLDEVVAIGYGTKVKPKITEAITSVNEKDMKLTVNPSLENAMQGRMAGVTVTQTSGAPGSTSSVKVRGLGSLSNSEPLYVIDGLPTDGSAINLINPSDIQTIDVLKDASATAIYGARGANGVVIITTKRGKEGSARVNFESSIGMQQVWKKLKVLDNAQYLSLINEQFKNVGQTLPAAFSDANNSYLNNNTNWQDQIFKTGYQQNYNLSISGGNGNGTYSISGGYFKNDGTVISSAFDRYSFRVNSDLNIKKWLRVGESVSISRTNDKTGFSPNALIYNSSLMTPLLPVRDNTGNFALIDSTKLGGFNWPNPVALNASKNNSTVNFRTLGNIYAELEPLQGLKYRFNFGLDLINTTTTGLNELFNSGDAKPYQADVFKRNVSYEAKYSLVKLFDNILSYQKTFGEKHDFLILGGISMQDFSDQNISGNNSTVPTSINTVGYGGNGILTGSTAGQAALKGYLGRINYSYANKYLLTINTRYDGSSKFGSENRYGLFPSASIGWRPLEEKFISTIPFVKAYFSDLKFRASWGVTGSQDALLSNRIFTIMNDKIKYPVGDSVKPGIAPQNLANRFLKWEEVTQTNFGVDLGLFKNKISFTFDYFIKQNKGMLIELPIPATSGFYLEGENNSFKQWINAGDMTNKGYELSLTYRNEDHALKYSVGGNLSQITNRVTKLGDKDSPIFSGDATTSNTITQVNGTVGAFYGYKVDKIAQNQADIDAAAAQNKGTRDLTKPGDILFKDTNGDGIIDAKDRVVIGNSIPKISFGANFSAEYKGIDFKLFLQGVAGNDLLNTQRQALESMGGGSPPRANQLETTRDRWNGEGTSSTMPRAALGDPNNNMRISDRWVESGAFMRIKNIQLGYTLPKSITNLVSKSDEFTLRIYGSVMNALTITKYKGYDPEVGSPIKLNDPLANGKDPLQTGIDGGTYPQARTYLAGLQISF